MRWFTRGIPAPDDVTPNPNDPASVPPATVGPPAAVPGDPHGVLITGDPAPAVARRIVPSPWSGWPAEWATPAWSSSGRTPLGDTAWMCIDLNASALATMPPYLVDAPPSIDAGWLRNPSPGIYTAWEEFAKQVWWDYQLGEAFILATARYATGFPARFHAVPPWTVNVEMDQGRRRYSIGEIDVTDDLLHIRYQSTVDDAHGHGPLEAGAARAVAAEVLMRYATDIIAGGGIPPSLLRVKNQEADPVQAAALKAAWVEARLSSIGEPAVLFGDVDWEPTQIDPEKLSLVELAKHNESRIAVLLGVPPFLVGLPSGGDSMTYSNVTSLFDYHWRSGLRPKARGVMSALSEWLLPRGVRVEVNSDFYVQAPPLERAQADQILNSIVDSNGNPAKTVAEIREQERLLNTSPDQFTEGVLS